MSASSKARPGVRFLTAGAVALLGLSIGSMLTNAAGSDGSSSFVPMTPCRLMDTRSTSQVGPRGTPIGANELHSATVWGSNGNCVIPATATAVSLNVTFVNPTSAGFVSVFPPDKPNPGTSNLNFTAGQAPAPNGVTSPLSFDGKIGFFNAAGTVNLIADIVGYYEQAGSAPGGIVAGHCYAILRWDLPECKKATFNTGTSPSFAAFDGTYLWVTNTLSGTVSKINPATGSKVDFLTGSQPIGIVFDGTNIWVTNNGASTVSRFNPATGARTDFPTGSGPGGIAYDGTNIWVANSISNTVSKINPVTGATIGAPIVVALTPLGLVYDGTSIWVTNLGIDSVTKINTSTGALSGPFLVGDVPQQMAFDGINIWVVNFLHDNVSRINPATGAPVGGSVAVGDAPRGIAFDGTNMWVTNSADDDVSKIDVNTLARTDYPTEDTPFGVTFDGSNIWVVNRDDASVTRFVP